MVNSTVPYPKGAEAEPSRLQECPWNRGYQV